MFTYIPSIRVESDAAACGVVDAREDELVANESPRRTAILALTQLIVEPVLLTAAHEGARGVVDELLNVVVVPAELGDAAIVAAGIEHDQIQELAHLERTPDAQIIIHVHLADSDVELVSFEGEESLGHGVRTASIRSMLALHSSCVGRPKFPSI